MTIESLKLLFINAGEIRFEGTLASEKARIELKRCLSDIHDRIVTEGRRTMTADVRSLQFVDSSAIRLFVDWISRAADAKYKIEFLIDRGTTWQRLSFTVLKSMAPESVEIREMEQASTVDKGKTP